MVSYHFCTLNKKGEEMKAGIMLVVLVVGLMASVVDAQETNAVEVSYTVGVVDKYLLPTGGTVYDGRTMMQGDLTVSLPNGLYVSFWGARGFGDLKDDLRGDEVDYIIGWASDVGPCAVDIALVYYDIAPVFKGRMDNIWAPYVKVSSPEYEFGQLAVSPFGRIEVDIPEAGSSFGGGAFFSAGVDSSYVLSDQVVVNYSPSLTYDNGAYDGEKNFICAQVISLDMTVGPLVVSPNFLLTVPLQEDENREVETCFGLSVAGAF